MKKSQLLKLRSRAESYSIGNGDFIHKTKSRDTSTNKIKRKIYYLNNEYQKPSQSNLSNIHISGDDTIDLKITDISPINRKDGSRMSVPNFALPCVNLKQVGILHEKREKSNFSVLADGQQDRSAIKRLSRRNISSLHSSYNAKTAGQKSLDSSMVRHRPAALVHTVTPKDSDDLIKHFSVFLDLVDKAARSFTGRSLKPYAGLASLQEAVRGMLAEAESCEATNSRFPLMNWLWRMCGELEGVIKKRQSVLQLVECLEAKMTQFFREFEMKTEHALPLLDKLEILISIAHGSFNREQTKLVNLQAMNLETHAQIACDELTRKHEIEIHGLKEEISRLNGNIKQNEADEVASNLYS